MKNNPKRRCERKRNEKGFYKKIKNSYFKASFQNTNLARALKTQRVLEPRKTSFSQAMLTFLILVLMVQAVKAATVGHYAPAISAGMFESGNYSFPDSLFVKEYFNVSDNFWVSIDGYVGIGTTAPSKTFEVDGTAAVGALNTTTLTTADLAHFMANVTMDDNLTVGGNVLYVDTSAGRVGIGTAIPAYKLQVEGTTNTTDLRAEGLTHLLGNVTMNDNLTIGGNVLYVDTSASKVGIGTTGPNVKLDVVGNGSFSDSLNVSNYFNVDAGTLFVNPINRRVGIGTSTPQYDLEVQGPTDFGSTVTMGDQLIGYIGYDTSPTKYFIVRGQSTYNLYLGADGADPGTPKGIIIDTSGNVGIGTTSPGAKLEIKSTGSPLLHLNVSDGNVATITDMLTLEHVNASGEAADGIGSGILFRSIDDGMDVENISMIAGVMTDTSNGTERGALLFYTGYGNEDGIIDNLTSKERMKLDTEGLRIEGNLTVTGAAHLGTITFDTNATFDDSVNISQDLEAGGVLFVDGRYGNVGIGTASPGAKLSFGTLTDSPAIFLYEGGTGSNSGLGIRSEEVQFFTSSTSHFSFNAGGDLQSSGTNELVRITGGGQVGIGTASPSTMLEVVSNVTITNSSDAYGFTALFNVSDGDDAIIVNATGTNFDSGTMYVDEINNRVGIGTTAPRSPLDLLEGALSIGGDTSPSWPATGTGIEIGFDSDGSAVALLGGSGVGIFQAYDRSGTYEDVWIKGLNIAITPQGNTGIYVKSDGNVGIGSVSPSSILHLNVSDANVATITDMLTLEHVNASGEAADGIGSGILFRSIDDGMDVENISMIAGVMTDTSNASERGALLFYTGYGNEDGIINNLTSKERMKLDTQGLTIHGNLTATGAAYLGSMSFDGNATFDDSVNISQDLEAGGVLFVDGRYGNVGLGTMSPIRNLQVQSASPSYITVGEDDNTEGQIGWDAATDTMLIQTSGYSDPIQFGDNWIYLATTGNVGIGTTSPAAKLEVTNTSEASMLLNISYGRGSDDLIINDTGIAMDASTLYVDNLNNRVGIGTTAPGSPLDVLSSGDNTFAIRAMSSANGYRLGGFYQEDGYGTLSLYNAANTETLALKSAADSYITGGNVGIGTTLPGTAKLNVTGTVDAWDVMINGTSVSTSTGGFQWGWTNTTDIIYTTNLTDKVGIGTASPQGLLAVENTSAPVTDAWVNVSSGALEKFVIEADGDVIITLG